MKPIQQQILKVLSDRVDAVATDIRFLLMVYKKYSINEVVAVLTHLRKIGLVKLVVWKNITQGKLRWSITNEGRIKLKELESGN